MTDGPVDALREQAREWGRALLAAPPWAGVSDRVTLLLVDPPAGLDDAPATGGLTFWLTLDAEAARSLSPEYRTPLTSDRGVYERPRVPAGAPRVALAVMTDEALHRLLQGTSRPSMEARWQARHSEAVSDRLRRAEQYALRAGLLPDEAPERVSRTLWLEAVTAARGLDGIETSPAGILAGAGEVTAALCRLACFEDGGAYPPAAHLRAAARQTRLGRRIATWLDDLPRAVGGDEAASRRVVSARDQVLEEARTVLGERYRDRHWLREPEAFTLRPPR
ncbi:MAG: hypothetical protein M0R73_02740 [Dehalococcoidia bacterium]|nr:hypothetical protein [Dehalococcoidia bacterium]